MEKEEEDGGGVGVVMVVVIGMEEEMEEIMGSKRGRRWWLRVAGQGKQGTAGSWPVVGWKEDERKIKERERKGGVYIKGNNYYKYAIGIQKK